MIFVLLYTVGHVGGVFTSLSVFLFSYNLSVLKITAVCRLTAVVMFQVHVLCISLTGSLQLWGAWCGVHRTAQRHHGCHTDPLPAGTGEPTSN